jgi:hypothetical protein
MAVSSASQRGVSLSSCRCFLSTSMTRYGMPETLTSDRGTQFTSETWALSANSQRASHSDHAYHPQTNSLVELVHHQLKDALYARQAKANWPPIYHGY